MERGTLFVKEKAMSWYKHCTDGVGDETIMKVKSSKADDQYPLTLIKLKPLRKVRDSQTDLFRISIIYVAEPMKMGQRRKRLRICH